MDYLFDWQSPSSRQMLSAVLDILAEAGPDGLSLDTIKLRAGPAGLALGDASDLEGVVVAALKRVRLFAAPPETGCLRGDLAALLERWRLPRSRDEKAVAAVLSLAEWRPALRDVLFDALDGPLTQTIGAILNRSTPEQVAPERVQTLGWILRGLMLDRLRTGPRAQVDLERLLDFLLAGVKPGHPPPPAVPAPRRATEPPSRLRA